jgi:hypothetical protein
MLFTLFIKSFIRAIKRGDPDVQEQGRISLSWRPKKYWTNMLLAQ